MTFLMEHTMAYLNNVFVSKQKLGLKKYKQVMEHKFLANYMVPCNTFRFGIPRSFYNGLNAKFQM
jgi:hypothetical protein